MNSLVFEYNDEDELEQIARKILETYREKKIYLLYGTLGAGKTELVKKFGLCLNFRSKVLSPTYTLVNEYRCADEKIYYHLDLYRLKDKKEIFDLGYEEYLYSGSYCFIEWPEKIETLLPGNYVKLFFERNDQGRKIVVTDN